jgi:signal transduction histidine kinase
VEVAGLHEAQALERAIGRARWAGAAVVLLLGPLFPNLSLPLVFALGVALAAYAPVVARASGAARSAVEHRRVERLAFAGDLLVVSFAMLLFSVDPYWTTFIVAPLVIIGAAFRFGSEGTVSATLALGSAFLAISVARLVFFRLPFEVERVAFHLSAFLLTALMVDRIVAGTRAARRERERLIRQLERRVAEGEALATVGRIVGSPRGAAEVVVAVLEASRALFRFDRATVFAIDEGRGEYRAIHRLTRPGERGSAPTFKIGEGLIAVALAQEGPLLVPDLVADPRYAPRETPERRRSVIIVPLRVGGRPVAALSLSRALPDAFGPDDLRLAELVAASIAQVLENERLFAEASQAEALRALDKLKSEFLATVSHELRTPLTIISGALELIRRGVPDRQEQLVEQALRNVKRLTRTVQDLLDLAQLQEARVQLTREFVPPRALLDEVAGAHELMAVERGQRIEVKCDDTLPPAFVDRARMQQILGNLVVNAIRYAPPDSAILLACEAAQRELRFRVADNGPGIPSAERERIFDKFYRGERTRDAVSGTGLGLAIARGLVELQGGRIWVEDAEPGSAFIVSLPLEAPQRASA